MAKYHPLDNTTFYTNSTFGGGGLVVSPHFGGARINTLAENLRHWYATASPMNQTSILSQHQHHPVANAREGRGYGGGNNCNNNNLQNSSILTSLNKDIEGGQSPILEHKIWDKSTRFDTYDDVKLEYMDLEEFLIENELPIDSVFDEQQNMDEENRRRAAVQPQQQTQQQFLQEEQYHKRTSVDSQTHQPPLQPSSNHLEASGEHQLHHQPHDTNNEQQHNTTSSTPQHQQQQLQPPPHHGSNIIAPSLQQAPASAREPIVPPSAQRSSINPNISAQTMISPSSINVLSSSVCLQQATTNGAPTSGEHLQRIPIKAESQDTVSRKNIDTSSSSFDSRLESGMYDDPGEEKLSLSAMSRIACSPDGLSPAGKKLDDGMRSYSFGDDDLKPPRDTMDESPESPGGTLRKQNKSMEGGEDSKDDRYWERRRKNNMAAKRSRDARRVKENQIAMKATFYERENKLLSQELQKSRAEIHLLRERLCKYEVV